MKKNQIAPVSYKIVLLLLCGVSKLSFGQIVNSTDNSPSYQLANDSDMAFMSMRIVSGGDEDPIGSFYLNEEFLPGTILFHSTKKKMAFPVRYNAGAKEIEIKKDEKTMAVSPVDNMEILVDNRSFVSVKNPTDRKSIFVEKLVGGEYRLYDFYEIKVKKAPSDATLLNLEQKDEITIKSSLYFQIKDGKILPFPRKKKDLTKSFDPAMLDLAKRQGLNLKKKEDVLAFFTNLNSLPEKE